ncbi:3-methyl-2-oxobutanoate hydroxymethyltransferase [Koleobacter methoxysyntrophicus]|uniref:3-methyl-2-oxobutanoate hydroxymethyltransferase n=1 Tax=Koleobacter methoxysyntrophicus TaxID=2751313 RepID=A0A8A0RKH3_9FIRM|nr:3-methyl-2-oxobutanoate hydroxymethyltransferase [Koleobacter methoxysyntrophicus]QSQ08128.1 3-methyl-2-oxobutanoate hydroxymethyltransferase [Koleobacter methoxysyntrophicus]
MAKVTIQKLKAMKENGEKISMITAYDYPTALLVDRAGIEIILVGDSLAMTVLGLETTVPITMEEMIHHIRPVVRGAKNPMIVGDMPFGSYNESKEQAVRNATRLMKEGGCDVIKLEGGTEVAETVKAIVDAGIPVMGHIGLTPQTISQLGGFKVQGKNLESAKALMEDARALEEAGAFSIVLECVPEELGKAITQQLSIPTIGIGAGRYTDGQVLVFHDLVGLFERFTPKFVKRYANLGEEIVKALEVYKQEVKEKKFPQQEHVFGGLEEEDLKRLY